MTMYILKNLLNVLKSDKFKKMIKYQIKPLYNHCFYIGHTLKNNFLSV